MDNPQEYFKQESNKQNETYVMSYMKKKRKEIQAYLYIDKLQETNLMTNMKIKGKSQQITVGKNLDASHGYFPFAYMS